MDKQNVKTETEKMLAGEIYDPMQKEIVAMRQRAHRLSKEYNECLETDEKREQILDELMPNRGKNVYLQSPVQFDYGRFTQMGDNTYANFNFTIVDDGDIYVGDKVMFGPNVTIATANHPVNPELRETAMQYNKPVHIGENVWVGAGVTIVPGVTIGKNSVIGAGSVVVKDIPDNVVAVGNPCHVLREIGEHDREYFYRDEKIDWENLK